MDFYIHDETAAVNLPTIKKPANGTQFPPLAKPKGNVHPPNVNGAGDRSKGTAQNKYLSGNINNANNTNINSINTTNTTATTTTTTTTNNNNNNNNNVDRWRSNNRDAPPPLRTDGHEKLCPPANKPRAPVVEPPPNGRRVTVRKVVLNNNDGNDHHASAPRDLPPQRDREDGAALRNNTIPPGPIRAPRQYSSVPVAPMRPLGGVGAKNKAGTESDPPPPAIKPAPRQTGKSSASAHMPNENNNNNNNNNTVVSKAKGNGGWIEKQQEPEKSPFIGEAHPATRNSEEYEKRQEEPDESPSPNAPHLSAKKKELDIPRAEDSPTIGSTNGFTAQLSLLNSQLWGSYLDAFQDAVISPTRSEDGTTGGGEPAKEYESTHTDRYERNTAAPTQQRAASPMGEDTKARLDVWANASLLMSPAVAATAHPSNNYYYYNYHMEYAGENKELNTMLHNVLVQLVHRDRPPQVKYPDKMPLEMGKTHKKRRPRTPRSFYGLKGPKSHPHWFHDALDNAKMVRSPDLSVLEMHEEAARKMTRGGKR